MSDCDALIAAVEEAQRIISLYDGSGPRRNQDELLAMLQFILCAPSVAAATCRLKSTGQSDIVAENDNIELVAGADARIRNHRAPV
jgi:hypothetical protein